MKDYADQQRRLHQDISNFMIRNRDLSRHQEETEQKKQQESSKAAKDSAHENSNSSSKPDTGDSDVAPVQAIQDVKPPSEERKDLPNNAGHNIALEDIDVKVAQCDTVRKGDQLQLNLVPVSHIMTLESPAFIPECSLPIVTPPSEEEVAREVAAYTAACATEDIPVEFPPSPMSPSAKLPSLLDSSDESNKCDDNGVSTNSRRHFVISKVQESISPKIDYSMQHSTICQIDHSEFPGSSADDSAKPFVEPCDSYELDNRICADTDLNENQSHGTHSSISDSHISTDIQGASVNLTESETSEACKLVTVHTSEPESSDPNHNSLGWSEDGDKPQDTNNSSALNGVTQAIADAMGTFEIEKPVELLKTTSE